MPREMVPYLVSACYQSKYFLHGIAFQSDDAFSESAWWEGAVFSRLISGGNRRPLRAAMRSPASKKRDADKS